MDKFLFFRSNLLQWAEQNKRPLPWKGIKNPYLIWLSEILLQQTRVEQGLPYYEKFKAAFPTINDLANAHEDEVMKLWEGLGYYSRARNMHATAKFIAHEKKGQFPSTYESILELKGVGPYTAAAIASFAFQLPHAVVDGNVYRVLARFFAISTPSDSAAGKKEFTNLANQVLDKKQPDIFNQALMDFGATHCTPKKPKCTSCPMHAKCGAFAINQVAQFPVKRKKIKRKERFFHYLLLNFNDQIILQKRTQKDIWQQLYQFPLIEHSSLLEDVEELQRFPTWHQFVEDSNWELQRKSKVFKQPLSHQFIYAIFWEIQLHSTINSVEFPFILVDRKNLSKFAFPKIIDWYLNDNSLYLNLL